MTFLQNAHLIDPEQGSVEKGNLLINDGIIAAKGALLSLIHI